MSTYRGNPGDGLKAIWYGLTRNREFNRGAAWGLIIISALLAFEIFNFNTTQFALRDILGDLKSGGMSWATILAIAFCGIDFAGIARIFTPEQGRDEPTEVYYLFGAWLLAAGFNLLRSKGSHRIYLKAGVRVVLPFHSGRSLHPKIVAQVVRAIESASDPRP